MVRSVKLYNNFQINKQHKNSIILIGNFDGVHLGHQKLFRLAQNYKKRYSLKVGVLTFEPMPKMFFNRDLKNFRISSFNQKLNLLHNQKVDFIISKQFTKKFSKIKSTNFIEKILFQKLKAKFIFVSDNFRFGNKREGNVKQLIKHESLFNYKIVKPQSLIKGIANLGYRPTFEGKKILLEVHLFNFSGNLYNKYLTVEFIKFIRKEKKFKTVDQLKKQIKIDLQIAKKTK